MRNHALLKYGFPVLALAGMAGFGGYAMATADSPGNPATLGATAAVAIISPLGIAEVNALNFGTITASTNASSNDFKITPDGNASVISGGNGSIVTDGAPGAYTISGEADRTIAWDASMAVGECDTTKPGVSWVHISMSESFTANADPVQITLTLTGGSVTGKVGGTINVAQGAVSVSCSYTVTAFYN